MRRAIATGLALTMIVGVMAAAPAEAKPKAKVPRVTHLSATVGPLSARPLTLSGRNLQLIKQIKFGKSRASGLRHHGKRSLSVTAPASRRAGAVRIYALSGKKWRSVASYTYLARPVVSRLSPASGSVAGGRTTVLGAGVSRASVVRFGSVRARIVSRSARGVSIVVPPGVLGAKSIVVTSPGGTSARGRSSTYAYVLPRAANSSAFEPRAATTTARQVDWVSRDQSGDAAADNDEPWVVSVPAGADLPNAGDGYYLPPGDTVYPAGFAGTVRSIASQPDGTSRITVAPTALDETLTNARIDYAPGGALPHSTRLRRAATAQDASYSGLRAGAFDCKHGDGGAATFTGEIGLRFGELSPVVRLDTAGASFDAYVTGRVTAYGKVSADGTITCTLKSAWVNANKKYIPVGTTGATITLAPAATLKITGNATASVEQTTRFTYGVRKQGSAAASFYQVVNQDAAKSDASATVTLDATLGLAIQLGFLDRVGVKIDALLYVAGKLNYTSPPPKVCANVAFGMQLGISAYLDVFVYHWDSATLSKRFPFASFAGCFAPDSAALPSGIPEIVSDTLPDATYGTDYDAELQTADNRNGSWQVTGGSLPSGLSLSGAHVVGTPTSVGSFRPVITFTDGLGRSTTSTLAVRVVPTAGFGGGDIQATLTWGSEADLDLHAVEPSGTEIWYDSPGPTDSGGELDHDANAGCSEADPSPAENVFWPSSSAESGEYDFRVVTYDQCGTDDLNWHLVVRQQGRVVIDRTGYGDSDTYALTYGSNGDARVRVLPKRAFRVGHTAK